MEARALFELWFDRLWRQRDASVIDELRDDDAGSIGLGRAPMSNADFRAMHARYCEIFETMNVVIERYVQQGDDVGMTLRFTGTTRRGRPVTVRGAAFARVVGDRITDSENLWDVAALLSQLDAEKAIKATTLDDAAPVLARH